MGLVECVNMCKSLGRKNDIIIALPFREYEFPPGRVIERGCFKTICCCDVDLFS